MVRVEHRRAGDQYLSNRYHLRTSAPFPPSHEGGSRISAATLAAKVRPYPEVLTQSTTPPPPCPDAVVPASRRPDTAVAAADTELLTACGVSDIDDLSRRCIAARTALG